jgi:hypothetical protein
VYGTPSRNIKTQNNSKLQSTTMTQKRNISPLEKTGYTPPRKNNSTFQLPRAREFYIGSSPDETVAASSANNSNTKDKQNATLTSLVNTGGGRSGGIARGRGRGKNPVRGRGGRGRGGIQSNDNSFNYSSSTVSSKGRGVQTSGERGATDNQKK